jgi:deazaflavin-dependent oxidoreductase (nitroreductase family)
MSALSEQLSSARVVSPEAEATKAEECQRRRGRRVPVRPRRAGAHTVILHAVAALHCIVYRWSRGRVGGRVGGRPVLLLTTRGRRSGRERTCPVCFLVADERLVLAAAAGGRPRHPAWYLNLRANPQVTVQLRAQRRVMVARVARGAEHVQLWERLCREYPICAGYAKGAGREIPVVVLGPAVARIAEYGVAA